MFSLYRGKAPTIQWFPKVASTVYTSGDSVLFDLSGNVTPGTTTSEKLRGIILRSVVSTDSDYATNAFVPVVVPNIMEDEFLVDVGTGTLTTAMVGSSFNLATAGTIDVTAQSHKAVMVTQFVSTTKAVVALVPETVS